MWECAFVCVSEKEREQSSKTEEEEEEEEEEVHVCFGDLQEKCKGRSVGDVGGIKEATHTFTQGGKGKLLLRKN